LYVRTAGIFFMQLELLKVQRFRALCHWEALTLNEERTFATATLRPIFHGGIEVTQFC
jgi:hypothetical protein